MRETNHRDWGKLQSMEGIHAGAGFLSGVVTYGGTKQEWSDPERLSDPERMNHMEKDPCWSNSWKPADLEKGIYWRSFGKGCIPWEGPDTGAGELPKKEGMAEAEVLLNDPNSYSPPRLCCLGERTQKSQEWRAQEDVGKWWKGIFQICFYLSLSHSVINWHKIKLIFPRISLVYTSTVTGEQSPCP